MRKFLLALTVLFPIVAIGLSVRLAFNNWIIDYVYAERDFPKDRYGLPESYRKNLAKLGLRAVLSDEGFEEFKRARLPDGRKAFNKREIKHMRDVKEFLKRFFPTVYIISVVWLIGLLLSKPGDYLTLSGVFGLLILVFLGVLVFSNYGRAFEIFHSLIFDPFSWRFRYTDTLLRIYPMKFWYETTKLVAIMSFCLSLLVMLLGLIIKKRN